MQTWERLAARGVWVHGSSDGLGDQSRRPSTCWPAASALAAADTRPLRRAGRARHLRRGVFAARRSGVAHAFLLDRAAARFARRSRGIPPIRGGWHASGPGRTARVIRETLGDDARISVWLDYEQWHQHVTS